MALVEGQRIYDGKTTKWFFGDEFKVVYSKGHKEKKVPKNLDSNI